jgi:DNA-binding beta-propeller fold protein YncE
MSVAVASTVRYSHCIGLLSQSGRGFNNPIDVAAAGEGRLYVLSRSNMAHAEMGFLRVSICTIDQEYIGQFATYGGGEGQLIWPTAIAVDRRSGHVYVSDQQRHDVQQFDRDGTFIRKWGSFGAGAGEMNRPAGLAVDREGNILVSDALNNRVQTWSSSGELLATWGEAGSGPGQFNLPWGIEVDAQGRVYVVDWRNSRVQQLTADGAYLASFGGPGTHDGSGTPDGMGASDGSLDRPAGVSVDSVGNVYVSDFGRDRVQVYRSDGSLLTTLLGDGTMTTWALGQVNADPEMSRLRTEFAEDVAAQERVFEGPIGVEVDEQDRIIVADCCKHRVQVYQRA